MLAARERSSFAETASRSGWPPPGRHTRDVVRDSRRAQPLGSRNSFGRSIYARARLVGCQPIVCSTAAMPDPIVDFYDEFLRQIAKHRVTYALTGTRLANFF